MSTSQNRPNRTGGVMGFVLLILYAAFLVVFYQLVVIPLALDLSSIGFLIIGAGAAISYFAIPKIWRRTFTLLSLLVLLLCYGVNSVYADTWPWRIIEFPVMFVVLGWLASSYGNIRWRHTFTLLVTIALLQGAVPLGSMPFYDKFEVPFKSAQLDARPIFPLYPLVSQGNTLYTLGDLPKAGDKKDENSDESNQELDKQLKESNENPSLSGFLNKWFGKSKLDPETIASRIKKQLEHVDVLRFSKESGYKTEPVRPEEMKSLPFSSLGLAGFPYNVSNWSPVNGNVKQDFSPVDNPKKVLTGFFDPLSVTVAMDDRANRSLLESRTNWNDAFGVHTSPAIPGTTVIGKGRFLPGGGAQLLLEGANQLKVVDEKQPNGPALATLQGTWEEPLTSDLFAADIDGDGIDEVLINTGPTSPSRIVKLKGDGTWETLWKSGRKSFRFEFVTQDEGTKKPLIIANDPSFLRNQDARYISAYTYENGQLIRMWRMYKENLVFPRPLSSGTWVVQLYGQHQFFLLKPFSLPLVPVLTGIYSLLILAGYGYQLAKRGQSRHV